MRSRQLALLALALLPACLPVGAWPAPAPAPSGLAAALDSVFADTLLRHAHLGVVVRSLTTGETLYERDSGRAFTPGSVVKLLTASVALEALGPDYRHRTRFFAAGPVRNGVLNGELVVRGGGDPTISTRFHPDPRVVMRGWADSLRARGISRIAGGIVGVDSAFTGPAIGLGWAWDDLASTDAPETGALSFNQSSIRLRVVPSRAVGAPAVVLVEPATQYVRVDNAATTAAAGTPARLQISRDAAGPGIRVAGTIPVDTPAVADSVAVRNPTDYYLAVLREVLREEGIAVEGQALDADEWPEARATAGETPLFTHASPPLRDVLRPMLQQSVNWIAETVLRTLGRERRGVGSAEAGAAVVDSTLRAWGVPTDGVRMVDGSGLSRYNLLSPEPLARVLAHMRRSPNWESWLSSLPIGGQSGTLAELMVGPPLRGNVYAKTGTLTGVRSLAGYLLAPGDEPLLFVITSNHHMVRAGDVNPVLEAALRAVVERE